MKIPKIEQRPFGYEKNTEQILFLRVFYSAQPLQDNSCVFDFDCKTPASQSIIVDNKHVTRQ